MSEKENLDPSNLSKEKIWMTFDQISSTYDRTNRFLSCGIDLYWRQQLTKKIPLSPHLRLLDLATGTCDQLISILKKHPQVTQAIGIDLSEEMLKIGQKKIDPYSWEKKVKLKCASATEIPLKDHSIDCITMSFGIRNIDAVSSCLKEIFRVLAPNGKVLILEFSAPQNILVRSFYLFYLRYLLPIIGGWISKQKKAYRYLQQTIETFPSGSTFCQLLQEAGFVSVRAIPLSFGIVSIYEGEKK